MKVYYDMFINTPSSLKDQQKLSFFLNGILADIVFDRKYYKKNIELKEFTNSILQMDYKIYLFASRTALYARVIKDTRELAEKDTKQFLIICNQIKEFLIEKNTDDLPLNESPEVKKDSSKRKKKHNNDVIDGWRKIINSK